MMHCQRLLGGLMLAAILTLGTAAGAFAQESQDTQDTQASRGSQESQDSTFSENEILQKASGFFGETSEGLAKAIEKVFSDQGRPNAYIAGEEVSGAIGVGVRYGDGMLRMKTGAGRKVYWQGPSIGFDLGADASKIFILIYHLPSVDAVFQRFPAVDGSFYFVAGVGVNYQKSGNIVQAPIRTGVGLRAGVNVGYMHYTREKSWIPL